VAGFWWYLKEVVMHKDPILKTWKGLNAHIMDADENECSRLLKLELKGAKRKIFALRLHARINYLRAHRERNEILIKLGIHK
jgi:hypothetical protein